MKKITGVLLMLLPSFLQVPIRRLCGQRIGKRTKIKFGTLLLSHHVDIGDNVNIGPFCFIQSEQLTIAHNCVIKTLSIISTRIIQIAEYVHIAPLSIISSEFTKNSKIEIGSHSRIFPFCWLDTGEGIYIGKHVGIGGHTLMFTHGVWSDYIDGGPVNYGPIKLHDHVWLPWRTFILPNVEIGENVIVGANSLVNKSFPKNVLIGGSPAKLIKEFPSDEISPEKKTERILEVLNNFSDYVEFKFKIKPILEHNRLIFNSFKIVVDDAAQTDAGDLLVLIHSDLSIEQTTQLNNKNISVLNHREKFILVTNNNIFYKEFISYLRRYGIRLHIHNTL